MLNGNISDSDVLSTYKGHSYEKHTASCVLCFVSCNTRVHVQVMSTVGPWSLLFFMMVVFLGSFYLLNLMLAVVAMSYETEAHSWEQVCSYSMYIVAGEIEFS